MWLALKSLYFYMLGKAIQDSTLCNPNLRVSFILVSILPLQHQHSDQSVAVFITSEVYIFKNIT